nr:hypothetical protein [uncultured Flavobacterium sp.]
MKGIIQLTMKNKIYILFLFTILVSCNKKTTMEEVLISKPDEYWAYYNANSSIFAYYKLGKDKISQRYEINSKNKFYKYEGEGDLVEIAQKWNVSQDSILRFDGTTYDVISCKENVVVLYYKLEDSRDGNYAFLVKENTNHRQKFSGFYREKRIYHPEKYKVPYSWWTSK